MKAVALLCLLASLGLPTEGWSETPKTGATRSHSGGLPVPWQPTERSRLAPAVWGRLVFDKDVTPKEKRIIKHIFEVVNSMNRYRLVATESDADPALVPVHVSVLAEIHKKPLRLGFAGPDKIHPERGTVETASMLLKRTMFDEDQDLSYVYATVLHEFGHVLWGAGHSKDKSDVMFSETQPWDSYSKEKQNEHIRKLVESMTYMAHLRGTVPLEPKFARDARTEGVTEALKSVDQ